MNPKLNDGAAPCSPSFRHWLRGITPGFYTHGSWSWRIGGTLVTHWGNDNVKIYHQGGRHTETHPANTERCREAIQALLSKAELEGMEAAIRVLPVPDEDRMNLINAIHALRDTAP